MMTLRKKILTIVVLLVLGVMFASVRAFDLTKDTKENKIETVAELKDSMIGGITALMPDNSAKIFFESMLGIKLFGYQSYQTMDELLYALSIQEIKAAWFSDVTAQYLLKTSEQVKEIKTADSTENILDFAFAFAPAKQSYQEEFNRAIRQLRQNGKLNKLIADYIEWETSPEPFYEKDMKIKKSNFSSKKMLSIGVTGATPPIDLLDIEDKPVGFSVALLDEIGQILGYDIQFVVLNNDAAFSSLMAGKVDALLCYGTSKSTLDPGAIDKKKEYLMTEGYYGMKKYVFLTLE